MHDDEKCPGHARADGTPRTEKRSYPNETIRLLHERSSCRSFLDKKIPPDVLRFVLEAGMHAPTGGNLQPYSIMKIENKKTNEKLAELCENQVWIANAATNLLFCIDLHRLERWAELEMAPFTARSQFRQFWISFQDTIIAAQSICTAADAVGLGSVYIGTVLESLREIRDLLQLPEGVFPVVLLCLGYPKARPAPAKKLGVDIVVHDEKYNEMDNDKLLDAFQKKYPWTWEIKEERLERLEQAGREVHGEQFAKDCIAGIKKNGCISPAHVYFGLHYCADEMPRGNETFLEIMRESGFSWFEKYQPSARI